ncbi:MAG: CBS domain-containing protein [Promethearchaeota archaeon]
MVNYLKIIIEGGQGSGNTTMLKKFIYDHFDPTTPITIGIDFFTIRITLFKKGLAIQFWDFAGQERWDAFQHLFYKKVDSIMIVFDLSRSPTLYNAIKVIKSVIKKGIDSKKIVLVGNKTDLEERKIPNKTPNHVVKHYKLFTYIETSAKTGFNIEKAFLTVIAIAMFNNNLINEFELNQFIASLDQIIKNKNYKIEKKKIETISKRKKNVLDEYILDQKVNEKQSFLMTRVSEIMQSPVITFPPSTKVVKAIKKMQAKGISIAPVVKNNQILGTIKISTIMEKCLAYDLSKLNVDKILDDVLPSVPQKTHIKGILPILDFFPAVLIISKGKIRGIITKSDILNNLLKTNKQNQSKLKENAYLSSF